MIWIKVSKNNWRRSKSVDKEPRNKDSDKIIKYQAELKEGWWHLYHCIAPLGTEWTGVKEREKKTLQEVEIYGPLIKLIRAEKGNHQNC